MSLTMEHIRYLIYALLLYLPTVAGMRAEMYLLSVVAILFFERRQVMDELQAFRKSPFARKYLFTVWLVLFILAASVVNKIVNGHSILCLRDYYAGFYLFPLLIFFSRFFARQPVFRFLLFFTLVETVVAIIEYVVGNRAFLMDLGDMNEITDRSLLYSSRCYGLSGNSSVLAYKILIAAVLIEYTQLKKWIAWIARILLVVGALLSFGRSVIVMLILFWSLRMLYGLWKARKNRNVLKTPAFQFNVLVLLLVVVFNSGLHYQLSRGDHEAESVFTDLGVTKKAEPQTCAEIHAIEYVQGETDPAKQGWGDKIMKQTESVQTSGRKLIWLNYLNYVEKHLLFGNGSDKLMLRSWQNHLGKYKLIHAHNSFLMMLASNGLLIFLIYGLFYLINFRIRNWIPVITIVGYSLLNYGIFWGFSYMDVIFIILLTLSLKDCYDQQTES